MHNHRKQIAVGAMLSYAHIALGALITLLYTPFMIRTLGKSEYGLYNTVASVISSLSVLSLGFGSSYVRFFSRLKAQNRKEDVARLNGMFLTIFLLIGGVALGCGLYLSNHLEYVFKQGLTPSELVTAKTLMRILTVNLAVSFPASVFTSIITANEQFIVQKSLVLVKQVVSPLVCIPLLLMGYASVGLVVSTVIIALIADGCTIWFCFRRLDTKFTFRHFPKETFRELLAFSSFIAINMIVDQINLNIDKILLGRFCGTGAVAVYSAGYSLYVHYHAFSTSIANVFTPRVHHIWSDETKSEAERDAILSGLFGRIGRIQFIILWLVCSGLILFGRQFIRLWAGNGYENAYYVVLLLAVSAIVPLSQNVGIEVQRAKNKHQFRAILYAIMAVINLILSIYLCQLYGEIGSALGTAISFVVANSLIMDIFYHKVLGLNLTLYWKQCGRVVIGSLPAIAGGLLLCRSMNTFRVIPLLISIVIYAGLYLVCLYGIMLEREERQAVQNMGRKILRKG